MLLLASASNDLISRRPLSNTTRRHLQRTLCILNDRVSNAAADAQVHEVVLYVVGILASVSVIFGDYNAAKIHAAGISEIIRLRGGLRSIGHRPVIQISLDRYESS
jgi:hypothetical protein